MGLRDQFDKLRNYFIEDDDDYDYEDEVEASPSYQEPATKPQVTPRPQVKAVHQTVSRPQAVNQTRSVNQNRPVNQTGAMNSVGSRSNMNSNATSAGTKIPSGTNYATHRTVGSNSGMNSAYVARQPQANPLTTQRQPSASAQQTMGTRISMVAPHVYQDIMDMAGLLKNGSTLIVNFRNMADQQARRSIDFLTGVAFILDGDIQNIGGQSFLITPTGVDVDGAKESLMSGSASFENFDLTSY